MQVSYLQKSENNLKSVKNILSFCEFNKLFSFQVLITLQTFRSKQTGKKEIPESNKTCKYIVFLVLLKKIFTIKGFWQNSHGIK